MWSILRNIFPVQSCYNILVTRATNSTSFTFTLEFQCLTLTPPYPNVIVLSSLTAAAGTTVAVTYGIPSPQGQLLAGTFRLNVGGQWSADIPYDVSADNFEKAVHAANPAYAIKVEGYNWNPLQGPRYAWEVCAVRPSRPSRACLTRLLICIRVRDAPTPLPPLTTPPQVRLRVPDPYRRPAVLWRGHKLA